MLKRNSYYLATLIFLLLVSCGQNFSGQQPPTAKDGVLDLSSWDFTQDGPVNLRGEWKFKWMEDKPEFALPDFDDSKWETIKVPGYWEHKTGKGQGFGWYRLKVEMPESSLSNDILSIYLKEIFTSSIIYVNGQKLAQTGDPGTLEQETRPQMLPVLKKIPDNSITNISIAIKVANFHYRQGGVFGNSRIGWLKNIYQERWYQDIQDLIVLGILLMMALYHFLLYIGRREEIGYFWFGLYCLLFFNRLFCTSFYFERLWPDADLFSLHLKLEYLTLPLGGVCLTYFIRSLFRQEVNAFVVKTVAVTGLFLSLLVVFSQPLFFTQFVYLFQIHMVFYCVWLIYIVIKSFWHKQEGALYIMLGGFIFMLAGFNDILHSLQVIKTFYVGPYCLVLFIFSQSAVLSMRFANTFRRAEKLNIQLESAYNEIVEKERARTLFFHNTSHELRTPLNGILGFTELILGGRFGQIPKKVSEQVNKVNRLADTLKIQVNTILDLAKSKKGELKLEVKSLFLQEIKEQCQALAQGLQLQHRDSEFAARFSWPEKDGSSQFIGDQEKILTILRNLLGNAFKFCRREEKNQIRLEIELLSPTNILQITVSDTGIGIPPEQIDSIFEEFKQVEGDARRSFEGTGLGLTMVKDFVDLMSGKIKVTSTLNQGTTFQIEIPSQSEEALAKTLETNRLASLEEDIYHESLSREGGAQSRESIDEMDKSQETGAKEEDLYRAPSDILPQAGLDLDSSMFKILVVDDIQINVEVVSELLRSHGYMVTEAYGGRDALEQIKSDRPDLVLLDLMMPDVSGEDVIREVRSNESWQDLPIIIVTARASQDDKILGLQMGADDYIAKPIISADLILRVNSILTRLNLACKAAVADTAIEAQKQAQQAQNEAEIARNIALDAKNEAEEAHNKLQEMDQIKTAFFQNITHEFRTPLTLIIGPLESTIGSRAKLLGKISPLLREQHQVMLRNAKRLLRLINQLLDLAKLDAGKMKLNARPIDLKEILGNITAAFSSLAEKREIEFLFKPDGQPPKNTGLYADPEKLEKVFFNLLSNAFKFTLSGGQIKVEMAAGEKEVEIKISDTGQGIPKQQLPHIFERFRQVDGSTTRMQEGTGIGLSLVKDYIDLHHGKVEVASKVHQGTCFTIFLPLGKEHLSSEEITEVPYGSQTPYQAGLLEDRRQGEKEHTIDQMHNLPGVLEEDRFAQPRRLDDRRTLNPGDLETATLEGVDSDQSEEIETSPISSEKILLVEDNPDMRRYIKSVLQSDFYFFEAENGLKGLEKAKEILPDLVITDLMMPKMDGNQLLTSMRQDSSLASTPVILLTAKAEEDVKIDGLEAGADDYLSKPFNPRELMARAKNLLKLKRAEKEVVENVLKRYLPPDLIDNIMTGKVQLNQEIKNCLITFMSIDLYQFKDISSRYRGAKTARLLNLYLSEMTRVVFQHGGTIDKFVGDTIMVMFGAPVETTPQEQAQKAAQCAMEMQKAMANLDSGEEKLQLRVGIHQGMAMVGNFGSQIRLDYTAVGPTVDESLRIKSVCPPGQVLISGAVCDYLDGGNFNDADQEGLFRLFRNS